MFMKFAHIFLCSRNNFKCYLRGIKLFLCEYDIFLLLTPYCMSCQKIINFIISVKIYVKIIKFKKCKRNLMGVQYIVSKCYTVFSRKKLIQYDGARIILSADVIGIYMIYFV